MCGIVGILGKAPVAADLIDALRRLEYRGYDSAGIATVENGHLERRRAEGKLRNLEARVIAEPLKGHTGIGHTRWATHGRPTVDNAHPHMSAAVSVVHNGIIENYRDLKKELSDKGYVFESETDTEVVVHLITDFCGLIWSPAAAVKATLARLQGAFALGIIFAGHDNLMIAARQGSPLALGHGDGENVPGFGRHRACPVHGRDHLSGRGRLAVLTREGAQIYDASGAKVQRLKVKSIASSCWSTRAITAISWRRKSTSSPKSFPTPWPITSTSPRAASRFPISGSTWPMSRA